MIYIPHILRESSEGISRISVQDILLERRQVECIGNITEDTVAVISQQLRYLSTENPDKQITLYINSTGGEVNSGLALYDVMKAIKCPIRTVCMGIAASMAAVLFLSGDTREILPHSKVMIHDPLIAGGIGGSALSVDAVAKNIMEVRQTIANIISKHTGKSLEEVFAKTASDTYFNAQEAVSWGLADCIIEQL